MINVIDNVSSTSNFSICRNYAIKTITQDKYCGKFIFWYCSLPWFRKKKHNCFQTPKDAVSLESVRELETVFFSIPEWSFCFSSLLHGFCFQSGLYWKNVAADKRLLKPGFLVKVVTPKMFPPTSWFIDRNEISVSQMNNAWISPHCHDNKSGFVYWVTRRWQQWSRSFLSPPDHLNSP